MRLYELGDALSRRKCSTLSRKDIRQIYQYVKRLIELSPNRELVLDVFDGYQSSRPLAEIEKIVSLTEGGEAYFRGVRDDPCYIYSYNASVFAGFPCEIFTFACDDIDFVQMGLVMNKLRGLSTDRLVRDKCIPLHLGPGTVLCWSLSTKHRRRFIDAFAPQLTLPETVPIFTVIPGEASSMQKVVEILQKEDLMSSNYSAVVQKFCQTAGTSIV